MSVEVQDFLAQASALKNNWAKSGGEIEAVSSMGGEYIVRGANNAIDSMSDHIKSLEKHISDRNIQAARESLKKARTEYNRATKSAERYEKFAQVKGVYDGMNILAGLADPDTARQNATDMTSIGNLAGSLTKMGINSVTGLGGGFVSSAIGELTGLDPLQKVGEGIDYVGNKVNETKVGQAWNAVTSNTIGRGTEAVMKSRLLGDDKFQYRASNGRVYNTKEEAIAANKEIGSEYEPVEIKWDSRSGAIAKRATDGASEAFGSTGIGMLNPFSGASKDEQGEVRKDFSKWKPWTWRLFGNMRNENAKMMADLEKTGKINNPEAEKYRKYYEDIGVSSPDPDKWTVEDWKIINEPTRELKEWEKTTEEEDRLVKESSAHFMEMRGRPIQLYTSDAKTGSIYGQKVATNANYYQTGNNDFGELDPEAQGFFDDGGRPTPELLNYAATFNRPIELFHAEDMDGTGYGEPVVLEPSYGDEFWSEAGMFMRGIPFLPSETIDLEDPSMYNLQDNDEGKRYFFNDPNADPDDNKFMMFDQDNDEGFYRDESGTIQFSGEYNLDDNPQHLGSSWYEDDFYENYWQSPENNWRYDVENGWMYASGEESNGGEWMWRQDIGGWTWNHEDENGNKWLYGNDSQKWVSYDNAKQGNWNWLGTESENKDVQTTDIMDVVADKTSDMHQNIADKAQTQIDTKLDGLTDNVTEKIEFGPLEEVTDKVDDKTAQLEAKRDALMDRIRDRFG